MLRFEATLALRHLRAGGGQTVLTVSAVAAGVILVVFISSLIFGLRQRIEELITDILPHITITPLEPEPRPLSEIDTPLAGLDALITSRVEKQSPQRKDIENWPQAVAVIRGVSGVAAVAPAVTGQGFVSRGGQRIGVGVYGAVPEQINAVTNVVKYVYTGHYLGLGADEIVIGHRLSQDLGVRVGDRVRVTSSEGISESFRVAGIYDTGQEQAFAPRVYINLRAAQSLFATGTAIRSILVRTEDLFTADRVARRVAALLPYKVEAWSDQAPQSAAALSVQRASAFLISGFSLIASAFAIASVLIVSVLQKSKQIGILKSMGAKGRQILLVFTLEGLGIAVIGAIAGAVLGSGLVLGLGQIKQPVARMGAPPDPLFPSILSWQLIGAAMLAAVVATVVAAILPARRAARLDPVQAIR